MSDQDRPDASPDKPTADQPSAEQPTTDQPGADQPTTAWTRPSETQPPPPQVPPSDAQAPPSATGSGPLLSATPTASGSWAQPAEDRREVAPGLVFSGTAARFVAYLIDGFLLALVGGLFTSTIGSGGAFTPRGELIWTTGDWIASILTVAINGAYFIAFWSGGRRATLGQMLLKIQVGNAFDGKPLTLEQAVRRWLGLGQFLGVFAASAAAVGIVGLTSLIWTVALFFTTVSSPTKQGLHDRFANSAVVRPANAGNGLVYTCLFVFILLPIVALLAIISLVFVSGQGTTILSPVGTPVQP